MGNTKVKLQFDCPICTTENILHIAFDDVDWSYERLCAGSVENEVKISCLNCGADFNVLLENTISGCHAELLNNPGTPVTAIVNTFASGDESLNYWRDFSPPAHPLEIFFSGQMSLELIINDIGLTAEGILSSAPELIRRMVYATAISNMEAYLNDHLSNAVCDHKPVLERALLQFDVLRNENIKLSTIQSNPNIVEERTRIYLSEVIYHDLAKVSKLYKASLGINIFPDEELKERLFKSILIRHDIVHRNGKTKEGATIEFSYDGVLQLINDIETFVEKIDELSKEALEKIKKEEFRKLLDR